MSEKRPTRSTGARPAKRTTTPLAIDLVDEVAWTPALRGRVFASRRSPNPLHLTGGTSDGPMWVPQLPYPYDVDAAWTAALARSWSLAEWARPPSSIPVGYANATPALAEIARAALAAFGTRLDALDATTEAAMMVLDLRPSWLGMPLWLAMHGPAFATRVLVTAARWRNNEGSSGKHRAQGLYLIEDGVGAGREVYEHATAWGLLRGVLAIADEREYAAAREIADAARATLSYAHRAAVAFAFPDEPWCAEAVAAFVVAEGQGMASAWQSWQMLMATADLDDALRIAHAELPLEEPFALTLLARHGAAAVRVLRGAFATRARAAQRFATLGAALALIRTREALEAFVPVLDISAVKPAATRAFKAQPVVARAVLAPVAAGGDKAGKVAAAILAKL